MVDWGKVATGAATALVVGLGAVVLSGVSDGRLVGWMGGVPASEVEKTQSRVSELQTEIEKLKQSRPPGTGSNEDMAIPSGAVVAFDLPSQCPTGWSPFVAGQNVFIAGATFGLPNQLFRGNDLSDKKYRAHGGEEYVALTEAQMPKHRHEIPTASHDRSRSDFTFANHDSGLVVPSLDYRHRHKSKGGKIGWTVGGSGEVQGVFPAGGTAAGALGTAEPHQNMPPYIALYFCKKD